MHILHKAHLGYLDLVRKEAEPRVARRGHVANGRPLSAAGRPHRWTWPQQPRTWRSRASWPRWNEGPRRSQRQGWLRRGASTSRAAAATCLTQPRRLRQRPGRSNSGRPAGASGVEPAHLISHLRRDPQEAWGAVPGVVVVAGSGRDSWMRGACARGAAAGTCRGVVNTS